MATFWDEGLLRAKLLTARIVADNTLSAPLRVLLISYKISAPAATRRLAPFRRGCHNSPMTALTSIEATKKRVADAELKLKQQKELLRRQLAAFQAKVSKAERVLDARQKLLIGAYVLSKSGLSATDFARSDPGFSVWLSRDYDRVAFGLPTLSPPPSSHSEGNGHA